MRAGGAGMSAPTLPTGWREIARTNFARVLWDGRTYRVVDEAGAVVLAETADVDGAEKVLRVYGRQITLPLDAAGGDGATENV